MAPAFARVSIRLVGVLLLLVFSAGDRPACGQTDGVLQIHDPLHRFLLRQQTRGLLPDAHLSHRPLSIYEARIYLDAVQERADELPRTDRTLLARYRRTQASPLPDVVQRRVPVLYANGRDFLSVDGPDYAFQLNPLLYASGGYAFRERANGPYSSFLYWQNTRGARISGHIGRYLFFESRVEENQRIPPRPAHRNFTAPRLGRVKYATERGAPIKDIDATPYDYVISTGLIGLRGKYFEARLGRDRNLWGVGRGSVQLSNYASVYDQLQVRLTVWRFQYATLFTKFTDHNALPVLPAGRVPEQVFPRRYGAFHRLSISLPYGLEASLFEAVVFGPDSTGRRSGYELSYLNPVTFYRAVELDLGSPDNAFIGAGLAWLMQPGVRIYTEVLFDEFRIAELRTPSDGWWGNKWSWQLGVHATDVIRPLQLSMRAEYTRTRPFTYSHRDPRNAYLHYSDLLGHPAGPNVEEIALFLEAQPGPRWFQALTFVVGRNGRNTATENYGRDPGLSYERCAEVNPVFPCRPADYGLGLLSGVQQFRFLLEFQTAYELLPDLFLEAAFQGDYIDDRELGSDWYAVPYLTLRWGLPYQSVRY